MSQHRSLFLGSTAAALLCSLGLWAAVPTLETVTIEELPSSTIQLPNGTQAVFRRYKDVSWRVMPNTILAAKDANEKEICLEAKYDSPNPPDKIKLFNLIGTILIEDRAMFKNITGALRRGDNLFLCGELRPGKDNKLELRVIHLAKQPADLEKYNARIAMWEKAGSFEQLLATGYEIEDLRNNNQVNFQDYDNLGLLRDKSWERGLALKEKSLKRDDADGLFAVAVQWRELVKRHSKYRALVEQVLKLDPDHPRASRVAEKEFGQIQFEGKWMRPEQKEELLQRRKEEQQRMDAQAKARLEEERRAREKAIAERPLRLLQHQVALRTDDAPTRRQAVLALGEAIAQSPDPGFGEEGIDLVANLGDASAIQALEAAAKSASPEIRRKLFEALVWRVRQRDEAAETLICQMFTSEKDSGLARAGIDALISLDGKTAARMLIKSLKAGDKDVCEEISEGLKLITRQPIGTKEEWEQWWKKNQDTFNP